jgi:hypothetical protein
MSAGPWLFEKVEETLGPPSKYPDSESLNGIVSNRSRQSRQKKSAGSRKSGSEVSFGTSVFSATSSYVSTHHGNEIMIPNTKNAVINDLRRLERQLSSLEERGDDKTTTSSVTMTTITGASLSTVSGWKNSKSMTKRRRRVVVIAPPGKLGVHLIDQHDGNGTVVSEVRENSPLAGALNPGDRLVAVDEVRVDTSTWTCSQITSLIAKRAGSERRLTILSQ